MPIMVGKTIKPHCFKNLKYDTNKKPMDDHNHFQMYQMLSVVHNVETLRYWQTAMLLICKINHLYAM
jgi:hypothetical protein